jgi:hypothetical protein
MRPRTTTVSLLIALGAALAVVPLVGAQDPGQDDVRGAFLTSRPKTVETPANNAPAKPRRRPTPAPTPKPTATPTKRPKVDKPEIVGQVSKQRLGLGLTLFMRDSKGFAVRVDPAHEFHEGDMVRLLLETNADGFLYIFNTTDGGPPVMIYPDPWLDEAGNFMKAHVPFEIPSSVAAAGGPDWIKFDKDAGTERMYFVFTREPLAGVPIEDDLIKACTGGKKPCYWPPAGALWASLQKEMEAPLRVDASRKSGGSQSATEQNAVTRGIGLAKADPEPAFVMMSASSSSGMLVAPLKLLHK